MNIISKGQKNKIEKKHTPNIELQKIKQKIKTEEIDNLDQNFDRDKM